jgi:hypothetical protein
MHSQPTQKSTQPPIETELFAATGFSLIGFLLFIIVLM